MVWAALQKAALEKILVEYNSW